MVKQEQINQMIEQLGEEAVMQSRQLYREGVSPEVLCQMIRGEKVFDCEGDPTKRSVVIHLMEQMGLLDEKNLLEIVKHLYTYPLV